MDVDPETTPSTEDPYWYQQFLGPDKEVLRDEVPCDNPACNNEATFYATRVCCNGVLMHCRGCFTGYFHELHKREHAGYIYTCDCGEKNWPTKVYNKVQRLRLTTA